MCLPGRRHKLFLDCTSFSLQLFGLTVKRSQRENEQSACDMIEWGLSRSGLEQHVTYLELCTVL